MRIVLFVEVVLAAALAVAAWSELQPQDLTDLGAVPQKAGADAAQQVAAIELNMELRTPSIPPLESLSETLERPLFRVGRRPAPEEPKEPTGQGGASAVSVLAPVDPPKVKLDAVVLAGERRLALFSGGTVEPQRVAEGGVVDGWTVSEIREHQVVLQKQNQSETLDLRRFEAPAVSSKATPRRREPAGARSKTSRRGTRGNESAGRVRTGSNRVSTTRPGRSQQAGGDGSLARQSKRGTLPPSLSRGNELLRALKNR